MADTEPTRTTTGSALTITPAPDDDARRWLTPDEEAGVFDIDPWTSVLDDWAEELEHPFQYPSGLP